MRIHPAVLMAVLVALLGGACATTPIVDPSASPVAPSTSTASPVAPSTSTASVAPATPRPSVDGHPLSELLPTSINGTPTRVADLDPLTRDSPRVFLKVIARVGETPADGEVALGFIDGATVYALRVKGATGMDVLKGYLAERGYVSDATPPTESVGGKQATRLGAGAGQFLYTRDDVFYYVNCSNDQLAADLLAQLP